MKAPNLTPGDWVAITRNRSPYPTFYAVSPDDDEFKSVCDVPKEADARFLAASKKMAEALEVMVGAFNVEAIDPMVALISIEKAKAALLAAGYTEEQTTISFDDWLSENGHEVEAEWHRIIDEYGDAGPLLSAFKEQRYREAIQKP
jgi:hypothetical protein